MIAKQVIPPSQALLQLTNWHATVQRNARTNHLNELAAAQLQNELRIAFHDRWIPGGEGVGNASILTPVAESSKTATMLHTGKSREGGLLVCLSLAICIIFSPLRLLIPRLLRRGGGGGGRFAKTCPAGEDACRVDVAVMDKVASDQTKKWMGGIFTRRLLAQSPTD